MSLSQRQREILQMLSEGRSNKEIAHLLGLSEGTVKQHVFALFRKLKVTNRTMAVVRARQRRVDPAPAGEPPALSSSRPAAAPGLERRPVTVVAVEWRPDPAAGLDPGLLMEGLAAASERARLLAEAYDGAYTPMPGGDCFVCFGLPAAHGDDRERARHFAEALLSEGGNGGVRPVAAIVTAPAVVDCRGGAPVLTDAFRLAAARARSAGAGALVRENGSVSMPELFCALDETMRASRA